MDNEIINYWNSFALSGNINDYLQYKKIEKVDSNSNISPIVSKNSDLLNNSDISYKRYK